MVAFAQSSDAIEFLSENDRRTLLAAVGVRNSFRETRQSPPDYSVNRISKLLALAYQASFDVGWDRWWVKAPLSLLLQRAQTLLEPMAALPNARESGGQGDTPQGTSSERATLYQVSPVSAFTASGLGPYASLTAFPASSRPEKCIATEIRTLSTMRCRAR